MKNRRKRPSTEEEDGRFRDIFDATGEGLIVGDLETGAVVEANPAACAMHGYTREEFVGLLPATFLHPDSQHLFMDYRQRFRSGAGSDIRVQHIRRDGSGFHADWRGTALTYQGRPCLLAVIRDVSGQIQADQRLRRRVESRTREQASLLEISHNLASTLDLRPGVILEQLGEIIEYTHAGLFELTDSTLTALAVRGRHPLQRAAPFPVRPISPQTLAALYNDHRPIRVADIRSARPAARLFRSILRAELPELLEGVQAWMWVPSAVKGRIVGGLAVGHTRRNHFTGHHADLALWMADQVAAAMLNADLYEHAQELATLRERQRLAQDLHDAVNQSLFSAGLIAEVLPRLWERDPEEARGSLEDLRRLTRGALAEMRVLLAELRPTTLTDTELSDLVRLLANAFTGRTNIPVAMTVRGEGSLPGETQMALYRICQEALNNIAKHARASQVEVDGHFTPGKLELHIRDNGSGFVASDLTPSGHYGLTMMRERAEAVGAVLTVTSRPSAGTAVTIRWGAPEGS